MRFRIRDDPVKTSEAVADTREPSGYGPTIVTFGVSDPEVLASIGEYEEGPARAHFLATCLKIGVLSLKAARGTLDSDALRKEGDHLMEALGARLNEWRGKLESRVTGTLALYLDPQSGSFSERVNRLTKPDGDLAVVMRQQVQDAHTTLGRVFEQFIGENSQLVRMLDPSEGNQLIGTLQRALDGVIQTQNQTILSEFTLDNKDGALVRFLAELTSKHGDLTGALSRDMQGVVAEFSLDKEDSALSRLVARVESAQRSLTSELSLDNEDSALKRLHRMLTDHNAVVLRQQSDLAGRLEAALQSMNTRKAEAAKSTRHGMEFEAALGDHLREMVHATGDILQHTGNTTGLKPNCKVGDFVVTIGPEKDAAGAQIVIEAKESSACDLKASLEEAHTARVNRQAGVCIFVHSTATAHEGIEVFRRYGHDLVVKWNADDDALDVYLQAALMVATALSVVASSHNKEDQASFEKIDKAIEKIRKSVEGCEEITRFATTSKGAAEKILERARVMQEGLASQVQAIADEFLKLKEAAAEK